MVDFIDDDIERPVVIDADYQIGWLGKWDRIALHDTISRLLARRRGHLAAPPLQRAPSRVSQHRACRGFAGHLRTHQHHAQDPLAIALAIWFHDAIYDPLRGDNEERSALLAHDTLSAWGCSEALVRSVVAKVRATAGHTWTDGDPDTALFLDLDLSILGTAPEVYQRYTEQIAHEYAWVPPEMYRARRAAVLHDFLNRPTLYFTPALRALWEAPARLNLQRELTHLVNQPAADS